MYIHKIRQSVLILTLCVATVDCAYARSDENSVEAGTFGLHPRPSGQSRSAAGTAGSGFGWVGPAAITLVLAVAGAGGVLLRKTSTRPESGMLRVVGRTSIAPRHALALVQVGDRVLIVGHGPDGPPALLGEIDDPDEIERLTSANGGRLQQMPSSSRSNGAQANVHVDSASTHIVASYGSESTRPLIPAPHVAMPKFVGTRKEG